MKWVNKGHEFDKQGQYFCKTNIIYIYGCVAQAKMLIDFTLFVPDCKNDNKLNFVFVDRDINKQKSLFLGYKVISPLQFTRQFSYENGDILMLAISDYSLQNLYDDVKELNLIKRFNLFNYYDWFRYLSLFIWYRYNKLFFHLVDVFANTNCNLNCKHCFVQTYRGVRKTVNFELMKTNIQNFFNKVDYVYIFNGGLADGFAYRNLNNMIDFCNQNYSDRYGEIGITTNGTIIPNEKLLNALKTPKVHVTVDDYRENVELARKNFPKVISLLEQNKISFDILKRTHFDKAGLLVKDMDTFRTEDDLISQHDHCICLAKGFPYFGYKEGGNYIYSCCFPTINSYLNLIEETPNDYIDLAASPTEILEFILGYCNKGYLTACQYCTGVFDGNETLHVPVAEQIKEKPPCHQ